MTIKYVSSNNKGFSLVELMIACAIIGIMAVFSFSVYTHYIISADRAMAKSLLLQISVAMEKYYFEHGSYEGVSLSELSVENKLEHYVFSINVVSDSDFVLVAKSERDVVCGEMLVNASGERFGTSEECWK